MRRHLTIAAMLAVVLAATTTGATAFAQAAATDEPVVVDPDVQYWIDSLVLRLGDKNPTIQKSVYNALLTVGKQALPTLRHLAETADEATAKTANKLVGHIEKKSQARRASDKKGAFNRKLADRIGLTDDQMAQHKALREANAEKTRQLKEQVKSGALTEQEAKAAWKEMQAEMKDAFRAILTPEQAERLERAREDRPMRRRVVTDRRPGARGAMDGRMAKHLDLTEEQQAQVKEIHKAHREQIEELKRAIKDGLLDQESAARSRKQYQDELKIEMQGVLTAEQFEKFEKGMKRRLEHQGRRGRVRPGGKGEDKSREY